MLPLPTLLTLPDVAGLAPIVQPILAHAIAGEVASRLLLPTGLAYLHTSHSVHLAYCVLFADVKHTNRYAAV